MRNLYMCSHSVHLYFLPPPVILNNTAVLHPYYKLNYIKMAWGGEDEQHKELTARNLDAKNWQKEAEMIVEAAVCHDRDVPLGSGPEIQSPVPESRKVTPYLSVPEVPCPSPGAGTSFFPGIIPRVAIPDPRPGPPNPSCTDSHSYSSGTSYK